MLMVIKPSSGITRILETLTSDPYHCGRRQNEEWQGGLSAIPPPGRASRLPVCTRSRSMTEGKRACERGASQFSSSHWLYCARYVLAKTLSVRRCSLPFCGEINAGVISVSRPALSCSTCNLYAVLYAHHAVAVHFWERVEWYSAHLSADLGFGRTSFLTLSKAYSFPAASI